MRLAATRPNPTEQRPKEYPIYPQNCGKLSEIGVFWTLEEVEKIVLPPKIFKLSQKKLSNGLVEPFWCLWIKLCIDRITF